MKTEATWERLAAIGSALSGGLEMNPDEMKKRFMQFALRATRLAESLPRTRTGNVAANQLIRSATGAAANYRAACLGRSKAEFIAKLGIVQEETDESIFWMEFIMEAGLVKQALVRPLQSEGEELFAIVASSIKTARSREGRSSMVNRKSSIKGA